jgi:hypothetical protein
MMQLSRDPAFSAVAFATPQTGAKKPGFLRFSLDFYVVMPAKAGIQ